VSVLYAPDGPVGPLEWDEVPEATTSTPLIPIAMLAVTALTAVALTAAAVREHAGQTDEISMEAVLAWFVGSLLGLLVFARFGLLDARRRSTGTYVEPSFRPRLVAGVLVALGWTAGLAGAVLVAQAVARR
jgi:hypothetical protein